jgi:predicted permease
MSEWVGEVRHALRTLRKSPGFTLVAVISIGLGIGVNTAVLAVARATLLDHLPVPRPGELAVAYWDGEGRRLTQMMSSSAINPANGRRVQSNFSYGSYEALKSGAGDAAQVFAFSFLPQASISTTAAPVVAGGMLVSGNYFTSLGVPMAVGRGIQEDDDRDDAADVAVLSYGLWRRAFGGDPAVLSKTIRVDGHPFAVIGVTSAPYFGTSRGGFFPPADITLPLHAQAVVAPQWTPEHGTLYASERILWLRVMLRIPPSTGRDGLAARLNAAFSAHTSGLGSFTNPALALLPGDRGVESMRRTFEQPLQILAGVAALVFVLACVNVAGLVLARGVARRREIWIRAAIGASRGRLVGEIALESVLIAAAGVALAIPLALWGGRFLVAALSGSAPHAIRVAPDPLLFVAAAAVAAVAALLFGLLPARGLAAGAASPDFLRQTAGTAPRLRSGRMLIALQLAVSVPLVAGCALFLRTVHNLAHVDLGFTPANLVLFKLNPSLNGYEPERSRRVLDQAIARVGALPGARGATFVENALVSGWVSNTPMVVDGNAPSNILVNRVGAGFFDTFGMRIVAGRGIGLQDATGSRHVGVVNESAMRQFFGGHSPLGAMPRLNGFLKNEPIEIVGVARDSRYESLRSAPAPTIFLPFDQSEDIRSGFVVVRTDGTPGMAERIRAAVAEVDPDVPVTGLKTQAAQIDETIGSERLFTALLVFFGGFALMLACIGLHGVMSYSVERRTSELGIRVALGARRAQVGWLIMRDVIAITCVGLALGIPATLAAARTVRALLFGVEPADPLSLGAGAVILLTVALAAAYAPARRALRVDPLVALRRE